MAAPWNSVGGKLETACIAHIATITADLAGVNQLEGQNDAAKEVPFATAHAQDLTEEPSGTGNFQIQTVIQVASHAEDTTEVVHRDRVAKVFDLFVASDIATLLSAYVADFTCQGVHSYGASERVQDGKWINELTFTAYCCGSDL